MRQHEWAGAWWIAAAAVGVMSWSTAAAAAPVESPGAPAAEGAPTSGSPVAGSEAGDGDGLLGPISLGGFVGAGFPRPLSIEGFMRIDRIVGFGVEYSVMPKLSFAGTETKFNAIAADTRFFPFQDGFFVGFGVGHQHLDASGSIALPAPYASLNEQLTGETWFINPRIGFLTTFGWGGTIGIDAGVQIPLNAQFKSTLPSSVALSQDVNNVAHFFTKDVLPTVNLLRLGMML
jgi:hypothetical protein